MRKNRALAPQSDCSILAMDDDPIMTLSLQSYFQAAGYHVDVENDPVNAIQRVREGHYDILLLDFLMMPISGDQVVEQIRQFNDELYIILLTGHKSMAPPIKTIRELAIQGYYEKSDRFDQLELLVESCVKSIRQMRTIRSYQQGLDKILYVMPHIYKNTSPDSLTHAILTFFIDLSNTKDCFLALHTDLLQESEPIGPIHGAYQVAAMGQAAELFPLDELDQEYERQKDQTGVPRLLIPLSDRTNQQIGYLGAAYYQAPSKQQVSLLNLYGRQVAAAMGIAQLNSMLSRKNQELSLANQKLMNHHLEVIRLLRLTADARDIYTRGHSDRVSCYALRIAQAMGKPPAYCERVRVAGLFHDIGKIGISDEILLKPTKLTPEEYNIIKDHPAKGADMLASISDFQEIVPIVRAHHERWDGKGYPDGLAGAAIPEEARMIAIADSFDAMTSNRHYRKALPLDSAKQELEKGAGSQFDPNLVPIFLDILEHYDELEQELAWTYSEQVQGGTLS